MEKTEEPKLWRRILRFIDLRYLIVSFFTFIVWSFSSSSPNKLYFPKNDSNSLFPLKDSTVPFQIVLFVAVIINNAIFIVLYFVQRRFPNVLRHFSLFTIGWSHGLAVWLSGICINIFKNFVGRPRPNIIDRCHGHPDEVGCVNVSSHKLRDAYRSWPSGHASTAFSSAFFLALFIIYLPVKRSPIADAFACMSMLYAVYVGASRIVDFKHHTDDVLAGMFFGMLFAYIIWVGTKERIHNYDELGKENINNLLL